MILSNYILVMPKISPKCPDKYKLSKSNCSCKKITLKKPKKKPIKKKTKKKLSFLEKNKGKKLYFKTKFKEKIQKMWNEGLSTDWISSYGPNKGKCRKGYMKNNDNKFCYTWPDNILKKNMTNTKPKTKKKKPKKIKLKKKPKTKKLKPKKKPQTKKLKPKKKTIKEWKEECKSQNKIYDHKKRECRERKRRTKKIKLTSPRRKTQTKKLTSPKKQTSQKIKTPIHTHKDTKKEKELTLTRLRSYSPTINKLITRKNITRNKDLFDYHLCDDNEISIGGEKCYGWKTKEAEKYLLDNLKSKRPVIASNILGPYQKQSNCWFNSFFMMFFISDKARKFMKNFRRVMITGKINPKETKTISQNVRYPFWLLNKMIEASLIGKKDPQLFASVMDTNNVIKLINKNLGNNKYFASRGFYKKPGQAGNPLSMFKKIMEFFYYFVGQRSKRTDFGIGVTSDSIHIDHDYERFMMLKKEKSFIYKNILERKPKMIMISIVDDEDGNGYNLPKKRKAKPEDFKRELSFKIGNMEYKLDSVGIRDIKKNHICALITINGEDYMFDGERGTPLYKNKWRHLLNKNQNFKITENISETYNFHKSYQCLIYYRHK